MDVMKKVEELKIVPVVKLDRAEDARPLAEALCAGGLPVAEVTFRTDAAEESIRIMRKEFPEMLVGAGTVTNLDQAARAVEAGAQFIVSPGMSRTVVEYALEKGIAVYLHPDGSHDGHGIPASGGEVLPGEAVWRPWHDQSACGAVPVHALYAYRRNQCGQY